MDKQRAKELRPAAAPGFRAKKYRAPAVTTLGSRRHRTVNLAGLTSVRFIGEALRRRAWVWCGAAMAGLATSAALYVLAPTAYQAQTSILVTNNTIDDSAAQMQGDIGIAENAQVAEGAMDLLGSRQSVGAFLASYIVTSASDQVLLIITKASSADAAVREADAIAAVFLKFRAHELTTQQLLGMAVLRPLVASHKRQVKTLAAQIRRVTAERKSHARKAELRHLKKKFGKVSGALSGLDYELTFYPVVTQSMVRGTEVLDAAAPIPPSRRHVAIIDAIAGLVLGLGIGIGIVVVSALMSNRLRRRDDVARLLGSVVRSVGRQRPTVRRGRGVRSTHPFGSAAAPRGEIRHLSERLRDAIPHGGPTALAVVAVDCVRPAAMALASMAVARAREGRRVVLADLSDRASAARVLGIGEPGVHQIEASGAQLVVVVPRPGDIGPVDIASQVADAPGWTRAVTVAQEPADLLLSLAELNPAVGADKLATWATDVAVVVAAGRSAPKTIRAVGEMVRLAGMHLALGVLLRPDKTDESVGLARSQVGWPEPSRV
jgi:capsular polysaccharide biosynthesis protein